MPTSPVFFLTRTGASVSELPRNRSYSFCCGAGGAQMWKEEEHGAEHVNENRFREAMATGQDTLAVGCPKLDDAAAYVNKLATDGGLTQIREIDFKPAAR